MKIVYHRMTCAYNRRSGLSCLMSRAYLWDSNASCSRSTDEKGKWASNRGCWATSNCSRALAYAVRDPIQCEITFELRSFLIWIPTCCMLDRRTWEMLLGQYRSRQWPWQRSAMTFLRRQLAISRPPLHVRRPLR